MFPDAALLTIDRQGIRVGGVNHVVEADIFAVHREPKNVVDSQSVGIVLQEMGKMTAG
jgi:hypothetical protein